MIPTLKRDLNNSITVFFEKIRPKTDFFYKICIQNAFETLEKQ